MPQPVVCRLVFERLIADKIRGANSCVVGAIFYAKSGSGPSVYGEGCLFNRRIQELALRACESEHGNRDSIGCQGSKRNEGRRPDFEWFSIGRPESKGAKTH